MEWIQVFRPGDGHMLTRVCELPVLVSPVATSASPDETHDGVTEGFDLYIRYSGDWPDVQRGDVIELRGSRYRLATNPVRWNGAAGFPMGTVIHAERP